jgi:hypothetical protein
MDFGTRMARGSKPFSVSLETRQASANSLIRRNNHGVIEFEISRRTVLIGGADHGMSSSLACSQVSSADRYLLLEDNLPHRRVAAQLAKFLRGTW